MKFLRSILDKTGKIVKDTPFLRPWYPLFEATDDFFFSTSKVTTVPHILDGVDIKRYMTFVVLGLIPATLAGIYLYGLRILLVIAVSYAAGGVVEVAFGVIRKKGIHEGFLVTGLILPLILPPSIPLWMVTIGAAFATFFGKEVFGGTGRNIFNPALVGRIFLSVAFPEYFASMWRMPFTSGLGGFVKYASDAVTSATPLINFKSAQVITDYSSLLFGGAPGTIGETLRVAVILGGLFLIFVKIADWRSPLSYIASVFAFSFVANHFMPTVFAPPVFQILSGGLLFGAFFMATDPVSAPLTMEGRWICGIVLGVLTVIIRSITGFVEGVMFAILLMNAINPLIDSIVLSCKFKAIPVKQ